MWKPDDICGLIAGSLSLIWGSFQGSFKGSYKESIGFRVWEFPKMRGTLILGSFCKDPTILGIILGSPSFGNPHMWKPELYCC